MVTASPRNDIQLLARSPLLTAAGLMGASLLALAPAMLAPVGGPGPRTVAAVFPPWWSGARAVTAAARSSLIVRLGGVPSIIVVRTDHPDRLRADGAWLFLNPILGGCAPKAES